MKCSHGDCYCFLDILIVGFLVSPLQTEHNMLLPYVHCYSFAKMIWSLEEKYLFYDEHYST